LYGSVEVFLLVQKKMLFEANLSEYQLPSQINYHELFKTSKLAEYTLLLLILQMLWWKNPYQMYRCSVYGVSYKAVIMPIAYVLITACLTSTLEQFHKLLFLCKF